MDDNTSDEDIPARPIPRKRPAFLETSSHSEDPPAQRRIFSIDKTVSSPAIARPRIPARAPAPIPSMHSATISPRTPARAPAPISSMGYLPPRGTEEDPEIPPVDFESKVNSPHFRHDLNLRMGIIRENKKVMEQLKRERRQWVLEECLKRGMDLRQSFNS